MNKNGYTDSACHPRCQPYVHCCYGAGKDWCNCLPGSSAVVSYIPNVTVLRS